MRRSLAAAQALAPPADAQVISAENGKRIIEACR